MRFCYCGTISNSKLKKKTHSSLNFILKQDISLVRDIKMVSGEVRRLNKNHTSLEIPPLKKELPS